MTNRKKDRKLNNSRNNSLDRVESIIQRKRKVALKTIKEASGVNTASKFSFNAYLDDMIDE